MLDWLKSTKRTLKAYHVVEMSRVHQQLFARRPACQAHTQTDDLLAVLSQAVVSSLRNERVTLGYNIACTLNPFATWKTARQVASSEETSPLWTEATTQLASPS
jgi:hypothetical protein